MVWFSEDVVSTDMLFCNFLNKLRNISLEDGEGEMKTSQNAASAQFMAPKKTEGLNFF